MVVLALRETRKRVVKVPLTGLHKEIYESLSLQFSSMIATQHERVTFAQWGNVIMYLLEAATNPALLPAGAAADDPVEFRHPPLEIPPGSTLSNLIAEYSSYETPAKFIQLGAIVNDLVESGRKVLIWSNFVRNLQTIERMLARFNPAIVHGGIPSRVSQPNAVRVREDEIAKFRESDCMVLLANPAAMGEGVSLHQVCHDAIYLDRTFNAGQYLQSVDRIHRLGLSYDIETTITFLVTEGTIDEVVADRVETKARNLGLMLDDPSIATMALPDEEDVGDPIDVGDSADIAALFAHLRGDPDVD
jgi:SNF2 family DNA or RNA helicase